MSTLGSWECGEGFARPARHFERELCGVVSWHPSGGRQSKLREIVPGASVGEGKSFRGGAVATRLRLVLGAEGRDGIVSLALNKLRQFGKEESDFFASE